MNYKNELEQASSKLGKPIEEVEAKWEAIGEENNFGPDDVKMQLALFRTWFAGLLGLQKKESTGTTSTAGKYVKTGFGFVVAVENVRDWEESKRITLQAEFIRNRDEAYMAGKFAKVEKTDSGYTFSKYCPRDGREKVTEKGNDFTMPDSKMEIDGETIVPLETQQTNNWDGQPNKKYGNPRPLDDKQRNVYFIGEEGDSGVRLWSIKAKGKIAENWNIDEFRNIQLQGNWKPDANRMYPVNNRDGTSTLTSVEYQDDVTSEADKDKMVELMGKYITVAPLVGLEHIHNQNMNVPFDEKIIITEGNVTNMQTTASQVTGNRTLFIADLDADYSYEDGNYASTPCWVPPHIKMDFGIGSKVIVVGRTSQSKDQDGNLRQASINVSGIFVQDKRGNAVEYTDSGETESDWF